MRNKVVSGLLVFLLLLVMSVPNLYAETLDGKNDYDEYVKDFYIKLNDEQVNLRNDLIKNDPSISEWEVLLKVVPEIVKSPLADAMEETFDYNAKLFESNNEPFVYLYSEYGPFPNGFLFKGRREVIFDDEGVPTFGKFSISLLEDNGIRSTINVSGGIKGYCRLWTPYIVPEYKFGELYTSGTIYYDQYAIYIQNCGANSWANSSYYWYKTHTYPYMTELYGLDYAGWKTTQGFVKREGPPPAPISHSASMQITIKGYDDGTWYLAYAKSGPAGSRWEYIPSAGWH